MASSSLKISISNVLNQSISKIQKSTPLAVGILLSSAALLPTIQSAPAELAAGLAIGGTLLSGLGTNLITDLIKEKLYKVAGKKDEEILKETEKALLELWNEGGKKGEDFRKELSAFLQRNGILQMAMDGAPQETKNALLNSFAELAEKFDEFNWALKYIQESLAEISATGRQQVEASNEILAKVNLLLQMQRENQKKAPLPLEPKQGEEDQPRAEIENPYKGLAFFTQADGNTYFGREELTAQLLAKLAGSPFLALLGASGSGKSSLMRAGVIWALYAGGIPGSENWKVLVMRPGATPLEDLAAQVSAESRSVSSSLIREIKTDPSALRLEAKKILLNLPDDAKLVLAVDQFEEVFTQCQDENERGQFIAALTDATQHSNSRIVVLLTLRADYYGRCSAYPALAKLLSENQVLVGEMTDAELRRAISAPAENVGVRVEAGLPELIIEEARGEKGALPMISLALAELFKNRKTDTLKVVEYRELGGLNQVIATTADKVYLSLSQAEQTLARKILLDLVKTGETAEQDARQRVRPSTLASGNKNRIQVEELLNKLADARLIVKDGESEDAQVEVSHEALFRYWDKLRDWLEEAREEKNLRQKISEAANEWIQNNKDANLLIHRGGRLDDALKLDDLNPTDLEYIKAGDALRRKEQRDRERRTQITIFASIAAAVVFLVLGAFGLVKSSEATSQAATAQANANAAATAQANAEIERQKAEEQSKIALARRLTVQSQLLFTNIEEQTTAVLLSIVSMQLFPTAEAADILESNPQGYLIALMAHDDEVHSVAFSPDGKYIVSGSGDNTARVWEASTGEEIARMTHDGWVSSVAFSPDGKYVVSGSGDNTARVWEASTGEEIARMTHGKGITAVAFSPDGKYIVSGSWDNTARVWEASTGREIARIVHDGNIESVAFSPNSNLVLLAGCDKDDQINCSEGSARVWEVDTGREIAYIIYSGSVQFATFSPDGQLVTSAGCEKIKDGTNNCIQFSVRVWDILKGREIIRMANDGWGYWNSVAFSPDSKYIASGGCSMVSSNLCVGDSYAHVWEASTGKEIARMRHDDWVISIEFSPDGKYIVSGSLDNSARVWEASTGKEIARMVHDRRVPAVAFSPDGKYIVSGSGDNTARIWEADSGKRVNAFMSHEWAINSIAFSPDGKYIVSGSQDNTARVWETGTEKEIARMTHDHNVYSVAFSPDGKYVVSGSYDKTARAWEASTGKEIARMTHDSVVNSVAFSPDGKYIVSGSWDNTARVWEASTGEEIARITHDNRVSSVAFSPDGKYVVSGSGDSTARIWEATTGKEIARITHDGGVSSVAFSPDGKYVVSGSGDKTARVWEASTGREIARMTHDDGVSSVAFSPDGKYVVSGNEDYFVSGDNSARVWEASTGEEIARMTHDGGVSSVAFSPDGKYVVSGSDDSTARIWEASTGKEIAQITLFEGVAAVAFSPDGRRVASADRFIWIWHPEDLIVLACSHVPRNLTRAEWEQYIGDALPYQAVCPNLPIEE